MTIMKKFKRIYAAMLAVVMLLSITAGSVYAEGTSKDKGEVSILFSHDLHSHLDVTYTNGGESGGFGKIETCIEEAKKENPATFLLDAGDFSMGTLYQTIYETHAAELVMLGRLGYDATTFGNHEFDYRAEGVANMLDSARKTAEEDTSLKLPAFVSANIDWSKNTDEDDKKIKDALDRYGSTPYTVIEREGVRIGVFGVMGRDSEACAPESGLEFEDIIETSKNVVKELQKEEVDMIVCLSHSGTWEKKEDSEDELLAEAVPEIDVIVSGHTHTTIEKPIVYDHTYVVSSGCYGVNLGQINLVPDDDGRWKIKDYIIQPLDEKVETDEKVTDELAVYKKAVEETYLSHFGYTFDQVLAYSPFDFTSIDEFAVEHREDTLGSLISDSYIYAVEQAEGDAYENVDFAVVASGVVRESFEEGNITVSDVFNVSSLGIGADRIPGYPLVSVYLTGKELRIAAELDASVSPIMTTAQLYPSGMVWTFNPHRMLLNKVTEVSMITDVDRNTGKGTKKEIEDDKLYRVVSGLYAAQMLGAVEDTSYGILSLTPKDKDGNPIENYEEHIIHNTATGEEVKEWSALASYLESFEKNEDGISQVPDRYEKPEGRKIVEDSKNIVDLVKNPNKYFFAIIGIVLFIIAILTLIIVLIVKLIRKRHKRK